MVHVQSGGTGATYDQCPEDRRLWLWVAKEGTASIEDIDRPIALRTTTAPSSTRDDLVHLPPYNTNKSEAQGHPSAQRPQDSVITEPSRALPRPARRRRPQ